MIKFSIAICLILFTLRGVDARIGIRPEFDNKNSPSRSISVDQLQLENRVHNVGNLWLNITNYGYIGNLDPWAAGFQRDPCTNEWAPQLEFPGGSGMQYLYQSGLWIGAIIQEEGFEYPRVSIGAETGNYFTEMYPGLTPDNGIIERTTRPESYNCLGDFTSHEDAVSEQEFIATYTDTSRYDALGRFISHPNDGAHIPLGVKITQSSYAWSYNFARDFIIIDYEIENIADNYLKNLYVGLFVDGDAGYAASQTRFTDDLVGFIKNFSYLPPGQQDSVQLTINSAWVADNDGRPAEVGSGGVLTVPDITGARVVRAPNPKLRTSFNWWISDYTNENDFGPSWEDDGAPANWTSSMGSPETDTRKYFIMSNREFDYDQVRIDEPSWISANPQQFTNRFTGEVLEEHHWREPDAANRQELAAGYDARYLISWGPLGIFDYIDDAGKRVYRLNPGEKFSMTVAFVAGENFHDSNHPQQSNTNIDPTLFNFHDFYNNADWAAKVYDNPMVDTDGDNWYGEDTGIDGIYAEEIGDTISFIDWEGNFINTVYNGPDEGERDGILQEIEDQAPRPIQFEYTAYNELFDPGDGIPDFKGPPPPPIPILNSNESDREVILQWGRYPSEDSTYFDPFSRQQDFEGYRVYVSNTGMENEFTFLAEFDKINYAYFSEIDSMMTIPVETDIPDTLPPVLRPETYPSFTENGYLRPVGPNTGMSEIVYTDSLYRFNVGKVSPLIPRYYAVTAYDYGDPRTGLEPLETAKMANTIYTAPSGSRNKKPGVVPNPYRADRNYTTRHLQLVFESDTTHVSWENRNDGTPEFFPQTDRRIYFYNLPTQCLIRIFTVSGDLVQIIDHNVAGNRISSWISDHAEPWDLNSRNQQQVVSGLYIFSVEDKTPENRGHIETGKFVIIR